MPALASAATASGLGADGRGAAVRSRLNPPQEHPTPMKRLAAAQEFWQRWRLFMLCIAIPRLLMPNFGHRLSTQFRCALPPSCLFLCLCHLSATFAPLFEPLIRLAVTSVLLGFGSL